MSRSFSPLIYVLFLSSITTIHIYSFPSFLINFPLFNLHKFPVNADNHFLVILFYLLVMMQCIYSRVCHKIASCSPHVCSMELIDISIIAIPVLLRPPHAVCPWILIVSFHSAILIVFLYYRHLPSRKTLGIYIYGFRFIYLYFNLLCLSLFNKYIYFIFSFVAGESLRLDFGVIFLKWWLNKWVSIFEHSSTNCLNIYLDICPSYTNIYNLNLCLKYLIETLKKTLRNN